MLMSNEVKEMKKHYKNKRIAIFLIVLVLINAVGCSLTQPAGQTPQGVTETISLPTPTSPQANVPTEFVSPTDVLSAYTPTPTNEVVLTVTEILTTAITEEPVSEVLPTEAIVPTETLTPEITKASTTEVTVTATATPSPKPTATPKPSPTHTPVPKPSATPTPKSTNTPKPTSTPKPTNTATVTPTKVPTTLMYVHWDDVPFRSSPWTEGGDSGTNIIGSLALGTPVYVIRLVGSCHYEVLLEDGRKGYIYSPYLAEAYPTVTPTPTNTPTVTTIPTQKPLPTNTPTNIPTLTPTSDPTPTETPTPTLTPMPEYTYEMKLIGDKPIYSNTVFFLYIKTEDPDLVFAWDWRNCFYAERGLLFPWGIDYGPLEFCEPGEGIDVRKKVDDGYICVFDISSEGIGENAINIVRGQSLGHEGQIVASFKVYVRDRDDAEQQFIRKLIAEHSTEDMSDNEKLQAVCEYVRDEGFVYDANYNMKLVPTMINEGAYWETRRIDCAVASHIMKLCGKTLGYEAEIIFLPGGHQYTTVYINGEAYDYDASPYADSGTLDPSTINKITSWETCPGTVLEKK